MKPLEDTMPTLFFLDISDNGFQGEAVVPWTRSPCPAARSPRYVEQPAALWKLRCCPVAFVAKLRSALLIGCGNQIALLACMVPPATCLALF